MIFSQGMATVFDFEEIKSIKPCVQRAVYGYIRRCQQLLPSNNAYYNIPELVSFIILFYYNHREYFHIHYSNLVITENEIYGKWSGTAYGSVAIHSEIQSPYKWTLKIIQGNDIYFGISSTQTILNKNFAPYTATHTEIDDDHKYYAMNDSGHLLSNAGWANSCGIVQDGDNIIMTVDVQESKITFTANEQDRYFENIDFINYTYYMAVFVGSGQSVKLLDFEQLAI